MIVYADHRRFILIFYAWRMVLCGFFATITPFSCGNSYVLQAFAGRRKSSHETPDWHPQ